MVAFWPNLLTDPVGHKARGPKKTSAALHGPIVAAILPIIARLPRRAAHLAGALACQYDRQRR